MFTFNQSTSSTPQGPPAKAGAGFTPSAGPDPMTAVLQCLELSNRLRAEETKAMHLQQDILKLYHEISLLRSVNASYNVPEDAMPAPSVLSEHAPPPLQGFAPNPSPRVVHASVSGTPVAAVMPPPPPVGPAAATMQSGQQQGMSSVVPGRTISPPLSVTGGQETAGGAATRDKEDSPEADDTDVPMNEANNDDDRYSPDNARQSSAEYVEGEEEEDRGRYSESNLTPWTKALNKVYPGQVSHLHRLQKERIGSEVYEYLALKVGKEDALKCVVMTGTNKSKPMWGVPSDLEDDFGVWIAAKLDELVETDDAFTNSRAAGRRKTLPMAYPPMPPPRSAQSAAPARKTRSASPASTVRAGPSMGTSAKRSQSRGRSRTSVRIPQRTFALIENDNWMAWTDVVRAAYQLGKVPSTMSAWTSKFCKYRKIDGNRRVPSATNRSAANIPREYRKEFLELFLEAFLEPNGEWRINPIKSPKPEGTHGSEIETSDGDEDEEEQDEGEERGRAMTNGPVNMPSNAPAQAAHLQTVYPQAPPQVPPVQAQAPPPQTHSPVSHMQGHAPAPNMQAPHQAPHPQAHAPAAHMPAHTQALHPQPIPRAQAYVGPSGPQPIVQGMPHLQGTPTAGGPMQPMPMPMSAPNPSTSAAMSGSEQQGLRMTVEELALRATVGNNGINKKRKKQATLPEMRTACIPNTNIDASTLFKPDLALLNPSTVVYGFSTDKLYRAVAEGRAFLKEVGRDATLKQIYFVHWQELVKDWFPNYLEESNRNPNLKLRIRSAIRSFIARHCRSAGADFKDCICTVPGEGKGKKVYAVPLPIGDQFQRWFVDQARDGFPDGRFGLPNDNGLEGGASTSGQAPPPPNPQASREIAAQEIERRQHLQIKQHQQRQALNQRHSYELTLVRNKAELDDIIGRQARENALLAQQQQQEWANLGLTMEPPGAAPGLQPGGRQPSPAGPHQMQQPQGHPNAQQHQQAMQHQQRLQQAAQAQAITQAEHQRLVQLKQMQMQKLHQQQQQQQQQQQRAPTAKGTSPAAETPQAPATAPQPPQQNAGPADGEAGPSGEAGGASQKPKAKGPPTFYVNEKGVRLVRYLHVLIQMMRDFPKLPKDARAAVKKGVKDFLLLHCNQDISGCMIRGQEPDGQQTYGIPEHKIHEFLAWAFRELRRCFPDFEVLSPQQVVIFPANGENGVAASPQEAVAMGAPQNVEGAAPAAPGAAPGAQPSMPPSNQHGGAQ
ncbi:hypothetical protein HDU96_008349 [Phlyctochytrium bullatum]|nr:hypothetical protein HDU96_008349 [Phlyctochytrium bullatum]